MVCPRRLFAAAALAFALCVGTSCDRKAAGRDLEIYLRDGHAAEVKGRNPDALAAYQMALALSDKDKDSGKWVSIVHAIARVHGKSGEWDAAERIFKEALPVSEIHFGPHSEERTSLLAGLAQIPEKKRRHTEAEPQTKEKQEK